jgi:hypothetical protein
MELLHLFVGDIDIFRDLEIDRGDQTGDKARRRRRALK